MRRYWLYALCGGLMLASWTEGACAAGSKQTVWFYSDRHDRWCALTGHARFLRMTDAESAEKFEIDNGSVEYANGIATQVEEFQTNAEYENTLLATYALDRGGNVTSAKLVDTDQHENEPKTVRTYWYKVINGAYQAQSKDGTQESRKVTAFRQARALSSFPAAPVIEQARKFPTGGPFCTGKR